MKYALQLHTRYLLHKILLLLELRSEKVIIFYLSDYDKIFVYQRTTLRMNMSQAFPDEMKACDMEIWLGFTLV